MTGWSKAETAAISGAPLVADAWEAWQGALDCGHTGRIWSADELRAVSSAIARRPAFRQLAPGTPVIVALTNTVAFPVVLLALLQRCCNPLLMFAGTPLPALQRIAVEFGARYVVHDFIEGIGTLEPGALEELDGIDIGGVRATLLGTGSRGDPRTELPGEGVMLHPTSGTYGAARFCLRNQETAIAEARSYVETLDFYPRIRIHFTTPLSHGYGYGFGLLATLISDSTLAIDAAFNPRRVLRLEREQPSDVLALVPPMVKTLLDVAGGEPQPIAASVFYSGAPIDAALARRFEEVFDTPLFTNWGTTETGPITTSYHPSKKLAGVGRPLHGVAVAAIGAERLDGLGEGIGELEVRSPALMQGYVPGVDPARPIERFATGDIGRIDADGCVHLVGRIRDIVNLGGTKVDPAEVEAALLAHPAVEDAAVYPGLRANGTEFVQAAVVGHAIDGNALRAYCAAELDAFKVPAVIHVVDAIPRTPSGKAMKVKCPDYPDRLAAGAGSA